MSVIAPLDLVEAFAGVEVFVVGEAILDGWLSGDSGRLSREAPVPVVCVSGTVLAPGGAGNTAVNLAALGARVRLLSLTGDDADGELLRTALRERGVGDDDVLVEPGRRTLSKRRVMAGSQMLVRVDEGDATAPSPAVRARLLDRLRTLAPAVPVVVVSDYGLGLLGDDVVAALGAVQAADPRLLVVDAREPGRWRVARPVAVKPNADEVAALLPAQVVPAAAGIAGRAPGAGGSRTRVERVEAAGDDVLAATGAQLAAVTLDVDGGVVLERGRPPYRLWTSPVAASRAAGAGDSFTATLALALAAGADGPTAGELAAAAARVVVTRDGTASCTADELRAALLEDTGQLLDLARLSSCVRAHRLRGRSVVVTNGCFDVLHRGHVTYLTRAKALGDVLVVGLNSDDSVRRLRGAAPRNPAEDRAAVLTGLSCVDHVVVFDGETAEEVVDVVRPETYVKGGDYTAQMLPEAPLVERLGGRVVILPYLEDRSTDGVTASPRRRTDVRAVP